MMTLSWDSLCISFLKTGREQSKHAQGGVDSLGIPSALWSTFGPPFKFVDCLTVILYIHGTKIYHCTQGVLVLSCVDNLIGLGDSTERRTTTVTHETLSFPGGGASAR
jgi:hypothetical protein